MVDATRSKKASRKRGLRRSEPESSSSSHSSYRSSQSNRSVSFAETQRIRQIPALSDMSKRQINDVYYSDKEFEIMKDSCVRVLRKIVFRQYKYDIDGLDSEWRGLEKKTREGSDQRKANRDWALLAVLNEQKKQRKHPSLVNVEKIAEKCRQASKHCKELALQVAAHDASLVHKQASAVRKMKPSEFLPPPVTLPKNATTTTQPIANITASKQIETSPQTSPSRPTMAWNMVSPHDETFSHKRILSMMNGNKILGGSQRQLALAA